MSIQKRIPHHEEQRLRSRSLAKRQTVTEPIGNALNLYFANVTIGTPGQMLQLQIDTGSSDVWMTASGAAYCRHSAANCEGGTFTSSKSSSYKLEQQGAFEIQYVDNTGSSGDYFQDNFGIGGVTIDALMMGLAQTTTIGTGIIGVGFASDESICQSQAASQNSDGTCQTYPTVVEQLVNQKKISTRAYSLWLDDLEANAGSILFGGIDSSKYTGPLISLPIQPDSQSGTITSFTVGWTGFTITTPKATETQFQPMDFDEAAILDSGTSTLLFPDDMFAAIAAQLGASYSSTLQSYLAPCYLKTANVTFDFTFGGNGGPTVRVPVSEFLIDVTGENGGQAPTFSNGQEACELGFEGAQGRPILLGDTFLRSAYVVYDLDSQMISLAQTNFNPGSPNVQEISSNKTVPGVSSTATGGQVSATFSGAANSLVGGASTIGSDGGATALAATTGVPPLAAFTTAMYTGMSGAASSGGSGAKSAAQLIVPSRITTSMIAGIWGVFVVLGASMIFL